MILEGRPTLFSIGAFNLTIEDKSNSGKNSKLPTVITIALLSTTVLETEKLGFYQFILCVVRFLYN